MKTNFLNDAFAVNFLNNLKEDYMDEVMELYNTLEEDEMKRLNQHLKKIVEDYIVGIVVTEEDEAAELIGELGYMVQSDDFPYLDDFIEYDLGKALYYAVDVTVVISNRN